MKKRYLLLLFLLTALSLSACEKKEKVQERTEELVNQDYNDTQKNDEQVTTDYYVFGYVESEIDYGYIVKLYGIGNNLNRNTYIFLDKKYGKFEVNDSVKVYVNFRSLKYKGNDFIDEKYIISACKKENDYKFVGTCDAVCMSDGDFENGFNSGYYLFKPIKTEDEMFVTFNMLHVKEFDYEMELQKTLFEIEYDPVTFVVTSVKPYEEK